MDIYFKYQNTSIPRQRYCEHNTPYEILGEPHCWFLFGWLHHMTPCWDYLFQWRELAYSSTLNLSNTQLKENAQMWISIIKYLRDKLFFCACFDRCTAISEHIFYPLIKSYCTLWYWQYDDISKLNFLYQNCILLHISLKFVPKV